MVIGVIKAVRVQPKRPIIFAIKSAEMVATTPCMEVRLLIYVL